MEDSPRDGIAKVSDDVRNEDGHCVTSCGFVRDVLNSDKGGRRLAQRVKRRLERPRYGRVPKMIQPGQSVSEIEKQIVLRFKGEQQWPFWPLTAADEAVMTHGTGAYQMGISLAPSMQDLAIRSVLEDEIPIEARDAAAYYTARCRARSTFKKWQSTWRVVLLHCAQYERCPLPMSEGTAIGIIVRMAQADYGVGYIRSVRSTIAMAHKFKRFPDPTRGDRFLRVMEGITRELGLASPHQKAALLAGPLREMACHAQGDQTTKGSQDWAVMTLQYHTVFRRSTITALDIGDVRDFGSYMEIYARKSKTDQYQIGRWVQVGEIRGDPLDPVAALRNWLRRRGNGPGPLFRHLGENQKITDDPLSDRTVTRIVKKYAGLIGLDPDEYGSQSLRAGFITQLQIQGVSELDIAQQSGHYELKTVGVYTRLGPFRINLSVAAADGRRIALGA